MLGGQQMSRALLLGCAFALALLTSLACGATAGPPEVRTVWPATVVLGQTTTIVIGGQGFRDGAEVTFDGKLGAARSIWINAAYMAASIPGGLSPAQHSVEI